jgi:hypothetical protein
MPLQSTGVCCSDWEDYSLAVGTANYREWNFTIHS